MSKHVDTILTDGIVVTMNEKFELFLDGAVAIAGGKIAAVGPKDEIAANYEADETISCKGQYVLPGLINAHTHVPMTLLRGLADDLRLDVWLMGYIMPTEREFVSPEFCRLGTKLACAEMIRGGVTSFADMYYFEDDVAEVTAEIGLRGVLGQTILKFPAPDAESYEDSLEYAREYVAKWHKHPLITPAVAPHAPYSSTKEMLKQCAQLAMEYDVPVIIHLSEAQNEEGDNIETQGMRVVPWVKTSGLFNAKVLAAHCVHIDKGDMRTLYENDVTVSHNPTSNLKLASGIAPVAEMLNQKLTVGIGTDGTASNNDLDMFEEIRLATFLAKVESNDPTTLPARQTLLMATRQGAEALFLGDVTGSLEVGKAADIIVMDANTMHNSPRFERDNDLVYSQIVYSGKSADVAHVLCHGRLLMRDRQLLTVDVDTVLVEAAKLAEKIDGFLIKYENNALNKLVAVGGLERSESFEIQVKAVLSDPSVVDKLFDSSDVEILKKIHYRQYDTYFVFDDNTGRVRYREDDSLDEEGNMIESRARLTYTVPTKEHEFDSAVLLSHSRFIAPANRPLRFYQEYFQTPKIRELKKDRRRWHIHYQGVLFYINIDKVSQPANKNTFIEIKSRTWSLHDAKHKSDAVKRMLDILGITPEDITRQEYVDMQE
jgi:5-methylthioadenosine/S-adenosylhomocysteine deaminase